MPLFYAGQTDYINKLNLIGSRYSKSTFTCSTTATKTVDLSLGYVVVLNITGVSAVATTLEFINAPTDGTPIEVTIYAKMTNAAAHTIIWPSIVRLAGSASFPLTTNLTNGANRSDVFIVRSHEPSTYLYLQVVGQNYYNN